MRSRRYELTAWPEETAAQCQYLQWLSVEPVDGVVTLAWQCSLPEGHEGVHRPSLDPVERDDDFISYPYSKKEFADQWLSSQIRANQQELEDLEHYDQRTTSIARAAAGTGCCPCMPKEGPDDLLVGPGCQQTVKAGGRCPCLAKWDKPYNALSLLDIGGPREKPPKLKDPWEYESAQEPRREATVYGDQSKVLIVEELWRPAFAGGRPTAPPRSDLLVMRSEYRGYTGSMFGAEYRPQALRAAWEAEEAAEATERKHRPADQQWQNECDARMAARKKDIAADTIWKKEHAEELRAALAERLDWFEQHGYVVEQIGQGPEKRKQGQWCVRKDGETMTFPGISRTPPEPQNPAERPCKATVVDDEGRGRVCGRLGWLPQGGDGRGWPIEMDDRHCSNWYSVSWSSGRGRAETCDECGRANLPRYARIMKKELEELRPDMIKAITDDQDNYLQYLADPDAGPEGSLRAQLESNKDLREWLVKDEARKEAKRRPGPPRAFEGLKNVANWSAADRFTRIARAWPKEHPLSDDLEIWIWKDQTRKHSDSCSKGAGQSVDGYYLEESAVLVASAKDGQEEKGYWSLGAEERMKAEQAEAADVYANESENEEAAFEAAGDRLGGRRR